MKITDILVFNPRTKLPRNKELPFIEMANLPLSGRDIPNIQMRVATGSGSKFSNGDTILARITPCLENGKGGMIRNLPGEGIGHGSTEFIVMRAKRPSDQNFVYYLSRLPEFRDFAIKQMTGTSGRQRVNWKALEVFDIPSIEEKQREKIGTLLASIDDKIELNRQMNETLESIAQAIFKDWFVDFGPTRRKMEGATDPAIILGGLFTIPEKAREIADLFPTKLVDSEIGRIPQGWEVNTLGQHIFLTKGRSYKKSELQNSEIALVTLKSFFRGGGYRHDGIKSYTGKYKKEQIVQEGDLIIALTDVTQAADVIGKPAIVRNSTKHKILVASLDVGIVRSFKNSSLTKDFCYYLMLTSRYTSHSLGYTSGTTVLHLSKEATVNYKFPLPPEELIQNINNIISPLHSEIFNSEKENETLFALLELLLPQLMSGYIYILSDQIILSDSRKEIRK